MCIAALQAEVQRLSDEHNTFNLFGLCLVPFFAIKTDPIDDVLDKMLFFTRFRLLAIRVDARRTPNRGMCKEP